MTPIRDEDDTDDFPTRDRRRGGDALSWRVGNLEETIKTKASQEQVSNVIDDVKAVADELNSLRRAIVIFSLSMIGTGGMFLLGILTLINNAGH